MIAGAATTSAAQPNGIYRRITTDRASDQVLEQLQTLIRDGRLKPLTDPRALELTKRDPAAAPRVKREPSEMLRFLLSALDSRTG